MKGLSPGMLLLLPFLLSGAEFQIDGITFHFTPPPRNNGNARIMVLFGGRNWPGDKTLRTYQFEALAGKHNLVLLSPSFRDNNYWEPEKWSGKTLKRAVTELRKRCRLKPHKLYFYGYSAGSQCSNLFPAWKPENARAWVSHACGVFHEPTGRMRNVPGLVTCGDADTTRYIISRNFVDKCREKGINIIWKSFPNHPHDVPPDSLKLARAFLAYYHQLYQRDLGGFSMRNINRKIRFIGDDQEGRFYPVDSPKARNVLREDRVLFPSLEIAAAWGKPEK